jgi:hypothetical protein
MQMNLSLAIELGVLVLLVALGFVLSSIFKNRQELKDERGLISKPVLVIRLVLFGIVAVGTTWMSATHLISDLASLGVFVVGAFLISLIGRPKNR